MYNIYRRRKYMSITAKQNLIKTLGTKLEKELTAHDLAIVQDKLNALLGMYKVEDIPEGKVDGESDDFLQVFIDAKKIEGRSDKTLKYYKYLIEKLLKEINCPIRQITVFHLRNYLMRRKEAGVADKTLEGMRSVYCSYFGWLYKEGLLSVNPCSNLSVIKCQKVVRMPYSSVELEKLKEVCSSTRDKALVSFLLSTGCRISEVCSLNRSDINFQKGECIVLGKGGKERIVFINEVTTMLLQRYFDERQDSFSALFIGRGSERMTPQGIRKMLSTIASKANVKNVYPHRFRRTLATNLINHGMPIQEVATILGHDKLDTTMTYVYIDTENVHNSYRKYV